MSVLALELDNDVKEEDQDGEEDVDEDEDISHNRHKIGGVLFSVLVYWWSICSKYQ